MAELMESFEGVIYCAVIYRKFDVYYVLSEKGEFFRISTKEMRKIPRTMIVPKTPICDGTVRVEVEEGQRISFEALKKPKGKYRWAKNIKLLGLGNLE